MQEIPDGSRGMVQRLIVARLLVADRRADADVVEVASEALLRHWPLLRAWLQEQSAALLLLDTVRYATRDWLANECDPDWLVHQGKRLKDVVAQIDKSDFKKYLSSDERDYIAACQKKITTGRTLDPASSYPPPRPLGTKIFISYRRSDSEYPSGRIFDALAAKFTGDEIVFDVQSIPEGKNFKDHIRESIETSAILLAIIGRAWLGPFWERWFGLRRNSENFVFAEIELALEIGVPILPILLDDANMPPVRSLPPPIRPLTDLNAATVRAGRSFTNDIRRVIDIIEPLREQGRTSRLH